ncbi:ribose-5-phosphate isomerase [Methanosarcina thermophila]|jgi:ribose 5-phosphate isomerase A|uniref:Ribose-5-phosphate isomerase A n=3 Tax=Methanosarcina thermophila TaxID=2210 RepID=A0A1I7AMB2_METTE|nr:ribose 5-phosphate isomerase A [Methanosarcina thermophila]ALK05931.1 MAG: ribose 5-phosphate isomerase [Methanosarcina sp. 795]AKB12525.1 Ribose 5-phosphate isomerase A [Methanosarcina thermophila TM-1]AKB16821.1 Ribose 5-phosphate isomerase A [Methanosarcina thermophila CHTI-55]NLU58049.1 ribose 5-phosphate isomerase A [Methanosarcina thermophila]SFT76079.1 ribose-5-phosphate isomerase [Methanosarcina thermophila]
MAVRNISTDSPEKRAAGVAASRIVESRMVVGLGTGSTVAYTIKELGRRIREEGLEILGVVTSYQSEMLAIEAGIPLTTLAQHPELDIAIDGVDQIDSRLYAIKGGGAAHTREKIVSSSSKRFVVVADESKTSKQLDKTVPIEVLPFAKTLVVKKIKELGGKPELRSALRKDGPVITDNGNFILDVDFGVINDPENLALQLSSIPGVVEHGIFSNVDELYIGKKDESVEIIRR